MFEKIGQAAEKAARKVGVSRRGFLGRLGKAALASAAALGAVLLLPGHVRAGRLCLCSYLCPDGSAKGQYKVSCKNCNATFHGCSFAGCTCGF